MRLPTIFGACVLAVLTAGCGSVRLPAPLTGDQRALANRLSLDVIVVPNDETDWHWLMEKLSSAEVFRSVTEAPSRDAAQSSTLEARITDRCSVRRGGFIPLLPILTLGVVPQFVSKNLGYEISFFRIEDTAPVAVVPCSIKARAAVGWLAIPLNLSPEWGYGDPEETIRFDEPLRYEVFMKLRNFDSAP